MRQGLVGQLPVRIAASLMCADLGRLREEVLALEEVGIDLLHFDVADGTFVPNLLFGPDIVATLRPLTRLPFEVHLMVSRPSMLLTAFARAGADTVLVHAECGEDLTSVLESIHGQGAEAGLALNPTTDPEVLRKHLPWVRQVTFMTVEPGFAGQAFQPSVLTKLRAFVREFVPGRQGIRVEVDGSVSDLTVPDLVGAGADTLVGGSTGLFTGDDRYRARIEALRRAARLALRVSPLRDAVV